MEILIRRHEPGKLQQENEFSPSSLSPSRLDFIILRVHLALYCQETARHNEARIRLQLHEEDAPMRSFFSATVHVSRKFLFVFSLSNDIFRVSARIHSAMCSFHVAKREISRATFEILIHIITFPFAGKAFASLKINIMDIAHYPLHG